MLQDKKAETDAEKQKALLRRIASALSQENPDLYYQPTSQVARLIHGYISDGGKLNSDERKLMQGLSSRDLEILLSLH